MRSREVFIRGRELNREARRLPADTYRLLRLLHRQSGESALFVPIRSMQYLAVVDPEEILFVDAPVSRTAVVVAWQSFQPAERSALDEPVPYQAVYFDLQGSVLMPRLQAEFHKSLLQMESRKPSAAAAEVLPFRR